MPTISRQRRKFRHNVGENPHMRGIHKGKSGFVFKVNDHAVFTSFHDAVDISAGEVGRFGPCKVEDVGSFVRIVEYEIVEVTGFTVLEGEGELLVSQELKERCFAGVAARIVYPVERSVIGGPTKRCEDTVLERIKRGL